MKKLFQFSLIAFLFTFAIACSDAPKGEKVEAKEAQAAPAAPAAAKTYTVDTDKTVITWTGTKVAGSHTGTLNVAKGELKVEGGNLTGGTFVMDMNSIKNTDLPAEKRGDLEGHLKNGDFFETDKHPHGQFVVTAVKAGSATEGATHDVTGNLTMKGITKSVTLPANVNITDGAVTAVTPAFTINRTEWDITYSSGLVGTAKDKAINDEIGLVLQLVATAAPVQ